MRTEIITEKIRGCKNKNRVYFTSSLEQKHVKNVLKSQSWQKLCRSLLNVKIEFIENQPTVPKSENHNS